MLLKGFKKEIFRAKCNPSFESVHCFAHLDQDVSQVIPYLNAELGGYDCAQEPPSVTFKVHGKLITVHPKKIAINALKDEVEADKILNWIQTQINEIWERRDQISPSFERASQPQVLEILKHLPKSNCGDCGCPTCMVFAVQVREGGKGAKDCLPLDPESRQGLNSYLSQFKLDF